MHSSSYSKQEKNWGNMSLCNQLKHYSFLLLFYIKIAYFVKERIEFYIGKHISMKNTFPFKLESSKKLVKTSKFVSQKQTKKKRKKTNSNVLT